MGDLIVSSILLENSKVFNKFKKVHFLIKEQYLELFADYSGEIKIIGYNYENYRTSFLSKYRKLIELRNEGYEICINLTAARGILNEEMTHLVGAKETITLNTFLKYLGKGIGNYFNNKYSNIIAKNILNEYDKHFELLKYLSGNNNFYFNKGVVFPDYNIDTTKFNELKNTVIIAPFSSVMTRDWESDKFAGLINRLKIKNKIVLLGSKNQFDKLLKISNYDENITILAGELRLNELAILINKAKLFIGLDSGLTHIALKMNTPLIAIIGGGEFGRFFPYRESKNAKYLYSKMDCFLCHWECSKERKFCITDVTLNDVLKEIDKMLE